MVYKTSERVFIVNIFLKTKSHKAVREEFPKEFKREGPRDKNIRELVKKFNETGIVANKKHNFFIYLNTIFVKLLIKDQMNKSQFQDF
jgi:hypothetical protein